MCGFTMRSRVTLAASRKARARWSSLAHLLVFARLRLAARNLRSRGGTCPQIALPAREQAQHAGRVGHARGAFERAVHRGFRAVPLTVDEEQVFPRLPFDRPGRDRRW